MSLTSTYLNTVLTQPKYIDIIKHNIGVTRPTVLGWPDVIRENSKIHATRYAKLDRTTSDYPTNLQLLQNAVRDHHEWQRTPVNENNLELVEKYWKYFELVPILEVCNTESMFRTIIYHSRLHPELT